MLASSAAICSTVRPLLRSCVKHDENAWVMTSIRHDPTWSSSRNHVHLGVQRGAHQQQSAHTVGQHLPPLQQSQTPSARTAKGQLMQHGIVGQHPHMERREPCKHTSAVSEPITSNNQLKMSLLLNTLTVIVDHVQVDQPPARLHELLDGLKRNSEFATYTTPKNALENRSQHVPPRGILGEADGCVPRPVDS